MINFRQQGNFSKVTKYLTKANNTIKNINLNKYGREGVAALASATPVDTGKTANSWYYEIERTKGSIIIRYCNSNIQNGVPVAVVLQYGHATKNGGWVEGRDYINPAIRPIFDNIAQNAWKEVTKL
jgi:hypothetical protein